LERREAYFFYTNPFSRVDDELCLVDRVAVVLWLGLTCGIIVGDTPAMGEIHRPSSSTPLFLSYGRFFLL
jgi:hypothetical protein